MVCLRFTVIVPSEFSVNPGNRYSRTMLPDPGWFRTLLTLSNVWLIITDGIESTLTTAGVYSLDWIGNCQQFTLD
jgi:hypothetical protein